jgi:hypothetical protein
LYISHSFHFCLICSFFFSIAQPFIVIFVSDFSFEGSWWYIL